MLTCTITDFSCPPQTVKSSCRARFTVSISVDKQPLVEIHNCVLLYNQKLQAYYIGFLDINAAIDTTTSLLSCRLK